MPTDYILTEEVTVYAPLGKSKVLPAGSFVRPIRYEYIPQFIKEDSNFSSFDPEVHVFCYTHFGITLIKKSIIREAHS